MSQYSKDDMKKWYIKYPDIYDSVNGCTSLFKMGNLFQLYSYLKLGNDLQTLKQLKLEEFGEDMKKILNPDWLKIERKQKLEKLNKI